MSRRVSSFGRVVKLASTWRENVEIAVVVAFCVLVNVAASALGAALVVFVGWRLARWFGWL